MSAAMFAELQNEAKTTKRLLERVPADKFTWQPHPSSRALGPLALHVARIPGGMTRIAQLEAFDVAAPRPDIPVPGSVEELLTTLDQSIADASAYLSALTPEVLGSTWRMTIGDKEIAAMPRAVMLRSMLMNHWIHHRGQLSVYLRMLEVPIPIIYGRSADEAPSA